MRTFAASRAFAFPVGIRQSPRQAWALVSFVWALSGMESALAGAFALG